MNGLVLIKKQLHKKLEKLSEKKLSSNILIKEVIQINSKKLLMLTKYWQTLKRDNYMMNMDNKVFKMVGLQEEVVDLVIFSVFSEEEGKGTQALKRQSQSLLKSKSHLTKFIADVWKTLKSKDIEIVNNVMAKEEKMYRNVQNVKVEELLKSLFSSVPECILKVHKDVLIVKVKDK